MSMGDVDPELAGMLDGIGGQMLPEEGPGVGPGMAPDDGMMAPEEQIPQEEPPAEEPPGDVMAEVDPEELERAIIRAGVSAATVVAGATAGSEIREGAQGVYALVQALELLNAQDEEPQVPPAEKVPVMPHAVGMLRQALANDHGIDPEDFDRMLMGAHQHLSDLEVGGTPTTMEGAPLPEGPQAPPAGDDT